MKKFVTILAAVALLSLGTAAFAADTATVTVSATVLGTCSITEGNVALAFGAQTIPVGADVTAAALVNVVCPPGTNWTVVNNGGLNGAFNMSDGAAHLLPYTLTHTPAGIGTGTVAINGTLASAAINSAFVGIYGDTVTLTLTP